MKRIFLKGGENNLYKIDYKGRISIPSTLASVLFEQGIHNFDIGVVSEYRHGKRFKYLKLEPTKKTERTHKMDSRGRLLLPKKLRATIGIDTKGSISIFGSIDHLEVWNYCDRERHSKEYPGEFEESAASTDL